MSVPIDMRSYRRSLCVQRDSAWLDILVCPAGTAGFCALGAWGSRHIHIRYGVESHFDHKSKILNVAGCKYTTTESRGNDGIPEFL
jgi:hypothetical protein